MKTDEIIKQWKSGNVKPVYWLEGEEEYFIEELLSLAPMLLLSPEQRDFNLTVLYGKECNWADLLNACKRYPMFSERQVIILKEAQSMRDLEKLEPYFEHPMPSTVLIVGYKDKKLDSRKRFSKLIKEKGVVLTTRKLYSNELFAWAESWLATRNRRIEQKALTLLVDHVGDDLSRMSMELEKILLNISPSEVIQEGHVEEFVGVSREYNSFELQRALAQRHVSKSISIIQYFESNPKSAPIQLILPTLYSFFSKCIMIFGFSGANATTELGVPPFAVKDYQAAAQQYGYAGLEKILLLLHEYNLRSIGVGDSGTADGQLLKELVVKIVRS